MGEPANPNRPHGGLRAIVAVLVAAFSVLLVFPTALVLLLVVAIGVVLVVAFVLGHTEGLGASTFWPAHTAALVGLGVALAGLYGMRSYVRSTRRMTETWALPFTVPLATTGLMLGVFTAVLTRAGWGGSAWIAPALSASFVLATGYFVLGLAVLAATFGSFWIVLGMYRWSTVTAYRAGLATGLLIAILVPTLFSLGNQRNALPPMTAPLAEPGPRDLRELLTYAQRLEMAPPAAGSAAPPALVPTAAASSAALPPFMPAVVASAPAPVEVDRWQECSRAFSEQEKQLRASIAGRFRISVEDAHDVVRDALVSVCSSYVKGTEYQKLAAVFETAAANKAKTDYRRRRYLRCAVEPGEELRCDRAQPDLLVLIEQQRALVEHEVCSEPRTTQDIFYQRVLEDRDFAAIAASMSRREDEVRYAYGNLTKRLRNRLAERCGP